jgi:hypothetical protein
LWAYAPDEPFKPQELIGEPYRGIRPAPGYPACPEHAVKRVMFEVLGAAEIGMGLTENYAMTPASSVSGFYFSHPQARYFNVGRIGRDQLEDLARRKHEAVDGHPGLYVAAGYASRGVVWAGLLGEALADLMTRQPLPLEADLMQAIAPGRFARE